MLLMTKVSKGGERWTSCALSAIRARRAAAFQQMLAGVREEYLEFVRPPFAAPVERDLLAAARQRAAVCRILVEATPTDGAQGNLVAKYIDLGIKVRRSDSLPIETGGFRRSLWHDCLARSGCHQASLDNCNLQSCGNGSRNEGPV